MAKKVTKTTRSFTEKGLYDLETGNIIGSKDGEISHVTSIIEILAQNGEEISITIKVEDAVDSIED